MRPERVSEWREQLPPPFDRPIQPLRRRFSTANIEAAVESGGELPSPTNIHKRRDSAPYTVHQTDRRVDWLRFIHRQDAKTREENSKAAILKLRKLKRDKSRTATAPSNVSSSENGTRRAGRESKLPRSTCSSTALDEPTRDELLALTYKCFPPIEDSRVVITEYSKDTLRRREYVLGEVLASDFILQPNELDSCIRWVYVEYHKFGTFWGSDHRFSQWGTDPTLFEKSPIVLLQRRLEELDSKAGRPPLEVSHYYKHIGKYKRQVPGCPEYLGIRANSSAWLKTEPYELLLEFLNSRPDICRDLQDSKYNDLAYALSFIKAVECIRESAYEQKPGLRELHHTASMNDCYLYGNWDDGVERLEFHGQHTLLCCGSPRLYTVVADRLLQRQDALRRHPDCALLYYTLARVSIENDEMMQDAPERALNKVFAVLRNTRDVSRTHVELLFSLQQAVLDGLEYLEENKRELPIWGIPPFENHQVCFHPDHTPPLEIRALIQDEMDLIDKDFDTIIGHWKSLKSKVERYLDVLLQFRVLEQQELAVSQSHLAAQQQTLAIDEAITARVQSRSVIIFTAITTIFVPLSFFTSYFGMNFSDISGMSKTSNYFWLIAGPVTGVIVIAIFAIMKFVKVDRNPVLDEEKAANGGKVLASNKAQGWFLWGFVKTKIKSG